VDFGFFLTNSPTVKTVIIGPTEANERTPKPSMAPVFAPIPNPIARTSGTVMGPVVTPALSHPKLTKSSLEKKS